MRAVLYVLCLAIAACGSRTAPPQATAAAPAFPSVDVLATLVDRVWVVEDSAQVARGDVRVFLADGTLVMRSDHATPATGSWSYAQQQLRIIEEGQAYATDILELTPEVLRLRMHSPGEPVLMTLKSAGEVLSFPGTVQYLDIEGGHYVITDAAGTNFNPIDLPEEFRRSGLAVEVDARRRDDVMSISMTGPQIQVLRIRRAGSADSASAAGSLGGVWTVVGHHIPGFSAMDDEQARQWHGRSLRLLSGEARFGDSQCMAPRYERKRITPAALLTDYRLRADALQPLADVAEADLLEVTCDGAPWTSAGNRIIGTGAQRALLPWDGVFFELQRDHDFRAIGQEPGWRLDLRKGHDLHFVYDYGEGEIRLPAPTPRSQGSRTVYQATAGKQRLELIIVAAPCSDVMSGEPFAAQVTVEFDGRSFQGCGGDLAHDLEDEGQ